MSKFISAIVSVCFLGIILSIYPQIHFLRENSDVHFETASQYCMAFIFSIEIFVLLTAVVRGLWAVFVKLSFSHLIYLFLCFLSLNLGLAILKNHDSASLSTRNICELCRETLFFACCTIIAMLLKLYSFQSLCAHYLSKLYYSDFTSNSELYFAFDKLAQKKLHSCLPRYPQTFVGNIGEYFDEPPEYKSTTCPMEVEALGIYEILDRDRSEYLTRSCFDSEVLYLFFDPERTGRVSKEHFVAQYAILCTKIENMQKSTAAHLKILQRFSWILDSFVFVTCILIIIAITATYIPLLCVICIGIILVIAFYSKIILLISYTKFLFTEFPLRIGQPVYLDGNLFFVLDFKLFFTRLMSKSGLCIKIPTSKVQELTV